MPTTEQRIAALEAIFNNQTPQRFWQGMSKVTALGLLDKIMVGMNLDGSAKYADINQIVSLAAAIGGASFKGNILPSSSPVVSTTPIFYIASKGTYPNFGGKIVTGAAGIIGQNGTDFTVTNLDVDLNEYTKTQDFLQNSYEKEFIDSNFVNGIYNKNTNAIIPSTDNSWKYVRKNVYEGDKVTLTSAADSSDNAILYIFNSLNQLIDQVYTTIPGSQVTITYNVKQNGNVIAQYRNATLDGIGSLKIKNSKIFAKLTDTSNEIEYVNITSGLTKISGKFVDQTGNVANGSFADLYKVPVVKGNQVKMVGDTNFNTPGETNAVMFQFDNNENFVAKVGFTSIANGVSRAVECEAVSDGFIFIWFINTNGISQVIYKRDFKYKYIPYSLINDLGKGKPYLDYNLTLMGDSITDKNNNVWANKINDYLVFKSVNNYARGSATWRNRAGTTYNITDTAPTGDDNNVIWNQYNRLVNDVEVNGKPIPDVVAIFAGTNDFGFVRTGSGFGDFNVISAINSITSLPANDNSITNIFGSIRYVTALLREKWPQVVIILASPNQSRYMDGIPGENPMFFYDFRTNMEKCATYTACKFIDQQRSGINYYQEVPGARVNLGDGLHPSGPGVSRLAKFICKELINLL